MKVAAPADVFAVDPNQEAVHDRLTNWARWANSGRGNAYRMSPMFRMGGYQSPRSRDPLPSNPLIDVIDAQRVEKVVMSLPEKHKQSIVWWYVKRKPGPAAMRQYLGVTLAGLCELCNDARIMVDNRLGA